MTSQEHLLRKAGGPCRRPEAQSPLSLLTVLATIPPPLSQSGSLPTRDPGLETGMNREGHFKKRYSCT